MSHALPASFGLPLFLWLLSCSLVNPEGAAAQEGTPDGCTSPEHRQFDFWIGDWEVYQPNGKLAGTNHIEKILAGCVLLENWEGAGGSRGKSFNMYFRRDRSWRQTWVDGAGGRLDLSGGLEAGRMVLKGEMPGATDEETVLHEIAFTPQRDGSVKQHWRASQDGGENWSDVFVGIYRRKKD